MDPCSLHLSQHYFKLFECDHSIRKFIAKVGGLETKSQLSMLLASFEVKVLPNGFSVFKKILSCTNTDILKTQTFTSESLASVG